MRTDEAWSPAAGRWWRFSEYQIRNGAIRPTADAHLETYDPWNAYARTRNRGDEIPPPYADFANLRRSLGSSVQESEREILSWCSNWGLPGALLHQAVVVTLAPRWILIKDEGQLLVPEQLQFFRVGTGWIEKHSISRPQSVEYLVGRTELKGNLVPLEEAPEAWARTGVLRGKLRSSDVVQESLRETWWRFFPDVAEADADTYAYPRPLTEKFWRSYGEPYNVFLETLQCFTQALWDLDHHKPDEGVSASDRERVAEGTDLFEALLAPTSVVIVPESDGSFSQQWVCGSLLSAFAMMAVQDLTESRRVRSCASCGRLFVSQHPGALYCSDSCRWKSQKQRQRKNRPVKKPSRKRRPKGRK